MLRKFLAWCVDIFGGEVETKKKVCLADDDQQELALCTNKT
jgi:hypothetical protein